MKIYALVHEEKGRIYVLRYYPDKKRALKDLEFFKNDFVGKIYIVSGEVVIE